MANPQSMRFGDFCFSILAYNAKLGKRVVFIRVFVEYKITIRKFKSYGTDMQFDCTSCSQ